MRKIDGLGYEQIIALRVIRDTPNMEGSAICKEADCSFDELFALAKDSLIDLGVDRIKPNALHPTLTDDGIEALSDAERRGVV
jgi:hypothetical protein